MYNIVLTCPQCDNQSDFIEETHEKWSVNGQGEREVSIERVTRFYCYYHRKIEAVKSVLINEERYKKL